MKQLPVIFNKNMQWESDTTLQRMPIVEVLKVNNKTNEKSKTKVNVLQMHMAYGSLNFAVSHQNSP